MVDQREIEEDGDENEEDYDGILTEGHAGMLHDTHRHSAYKLAITRAISQLHAQGKQVKLLDIGCGTGLLAMYAAEAGAEEVVACERSSCIGELARDIVARNCSKWKCNIVVELCESRDLPGRGYTNCFNVIVSEVYDSEMVGEGCLPTYRHALDQLATNDCVFLPQQCTLYGQLVMSPTLEQWYSEPGCGRMKSNNCDLVAPISCDLVAPTSCDLVAPTTNRFYYHDRPIEIHTENIKDVELGDSIMELYHWDFDSKSVDSWTGSSSVDISNDLENCSGVLIWWKSRIGSDEDTVISTAPPGHSSYQGFRDHWMPMVFLRHTEKPSFSIITDVDDFGVSLRLSTDSELVNPALPNIIPRHTCFYNSAKIRDIYCTELTAIAAKNHITVDQLHYSAGMSAIRPLLDPLTCPNPSITDLTCAVKTVLIDSLLDAACVSTVSYYYTRQQLHANLPAGTVCIPQKTVLFVQPIQSSQLADRTLPPETIDGFDMCPFRDAVTSGLQGLKGEDMFEPLHLWEYEYTELSMPTSITDHKEGYSGSSVELLKIRVTGLVTNLVFSVGFYFGEKLILLDNEDYFNKVDCVALAEPVSVEKGSDLQLIFIWRNGKIHNVTVEPHNRGNIQPIS